MVAQANQALRPAADVLNLARACRLFSIEALPVLYAKYRFNLCADATLDGPLARWHLKHSRDKAFSVPVDGALIAQRPKSFLTLLREIRDIQLIIRIPHIYSPAITMTTAHFSAADNVYKLFRYLSRSPNAIRSITIRLQTIASAHQGIAEKDAAWTDFGIERCKEQLRVFQLIANDISLKIIPEGIWTDKTLFRILGPATKKIIPLPLPDGSDAALYLEQLLKGPRKPSDGLCRRRLTDEYEFVRGRIRHDFPDIDERDTRRGQRDVLDKLVAGLRGMWSACCDEDEPGFARASAEVAGIMRRGILNGKGDVMHSLI